MLLGSRIMLQRVTDEDLREHFRALDDGRSFWEHAAEAGHAPERWRDSIHVLDDLTGWIEMHIEQARVLQDTGNRIGIVHAIAGYVHADVIVHGRGDHAGATPMDFRLDPTLVLAETALELERLAKEAGHGTVGTIGEIDVDPCLINTIASAVRFSLDVRGPVNELYGGVADAIGAYAVAAAERRGMTAEVRPRQTLAVTPLDATIVAALEDAALGTGEPYMRMHSGAAHDTMCVAERVPSAMVFVPCVDGISHHPAEDASPADAALAAEIILNAIRALQ
jgi:hydantoinase/carbamoylase family amidase